jgi:hypothetical protein
MEVLVKVCNCCQIEKQSNEYYKNRSKNNGERLRSTCKQCVDNINKEWRKENNTKNNEIARDWRKKNVEKTQQITAKHYKKHSKDIIEKIQDRKSNVEGMLKCLLSFKGRKGILHYDDVLNLYHKQNGLCALSNEKMTFIQKKGKISTNMSIDRIDSSKGYDITNIRLVCYIVNVMKHTGNDKELYDWCAAILSTNN